MGSKKKSTIGYTYRTPAVMIFGTGHWDKLLALYYADKHCWPRYSEYIGINQQIYIDTPNLLGGDTSEGGIEGYVDVFNGLPTQARNSFLVSKLGSYVSALRGVNSMVFHDGFYWGTSNYYKQISALAQRIHLTDDGATQWYDEKAEVPVLDLESAQYAFSQQINDSPNPWYGTLDGGGADVLIGSGLVSSAFHKFGENQPKGKTGYVYTTFNLTNLSDSVDVILDVQFDDGGGIDAFDGAIMSQTTITVESGYATAYRYRLRFPAGSGSYFLRLYCTDQVPIGSATRHAILMTCGLVASASVAGNMNPAHILRETIVSQYGGMGRPSGSIDDTNFRAVADTLYDEGFGISTEWSGSTSCADFQQSILDVIDARMYVHPKTGLWTIKLLRDDYVKADLLTLGPRQIKSVTSWKRANPDDLPNSVVVTYWSRADLSDATVQSVNPAAVASSGALNTLTNDYTGTITSGALAVRVARRDRVAAGSPLLTAKLVCTRAAADLMPGDPFILSWPALEDDPIVCRVVTTTRGGIVNQNVILEVAEDVFSLADVGSSTVIGSAHANTDALQIGKCVPIVVEAPYYELLQRLGPTTVDAMETSEPGAGMLLASLQPAANAVNAIVSADGTEWATLADMSPTGTLNTALALTGSTGLVESADITWSSTPATGSHIQIDDEICRFDGLDSSGKSQLGRGCLDTVPAEHEAGVAAWAWDSFAVTDEVSRSEGDVVSVSVQPRSNTGVGTAVSTSITMAARAIRPYAPGKVKLNGEYFPASVTGSTLTFTWAHRDRLTQADSLAIDFADDSVGPESGTTYNLRVYDSTETVVSETTGITGTSQSIANPALSGGSELVPTALSFTKVSDVDYSVKLPSSLIDLNETFSSDSSQFTTYSETGSAGTYSIGGNALTLTHSGSHNTILLEPAISLTMPCVWVETTVNIMSDSSSGYGGAGVGIFKDANNFLLAGYDRLNQILRVQIKISGTTNFLNSTSLTIPASHKIALALVANSVSLYLDTGSGWVYKFTIDVSSYYDFRTVGNLTGWHPGFTCANGGGSMVYVFSAFKCGRFGGVGIRDMTIVTNEDGTPYYPTSTTAMFTATLPDMVGVAYTGVFTLNLTDYSINQVGALMVQRSGKIYADLAPHIIYYSNGNRRITIATWGNGFGNSIQVLHKLETSADLLSGTNVIADMTTLSLPGQTGTNPGAYDPMLVYDSANSRWLIAYTLTTNTSFSGNPFYPAAAYSSDLSSWTLIGSDTGNTGYEGTKILKANGAYWIMAGGPAGSSTSSRVYNASMTYQGGLSAVFEGGTLTQPHPMVFPYGDKQIILTFDDTRENSGSFTWGNKLVYEAARYSMAESTFRVELEAERDGYTSFQKYNFTFTTGSGS